MNLIYFLIPSIILIIIGCLWLKDTLKNKEKDAEDEYYIKANDYIRSIAFIILGVMLLILFFIKAVE